MRTQWTKRRVGGCVLAVVSVVLPLIVTLMDLKIPTSFGYPAVAVCVVFALIGIGLWAWPTASVITPEIGLRAGKGGNAIVTGSGIAKGGAGGAIGGGDGGSAYVGGDGMALGGEAGQADRGGRNPLEANGGPNVQLPDGTWIFDYGRGGAPGKFINLTPDVELSEAIAFAFFRQWRRRYSEAAAREDSPIDQVLGRVVERVRAGSLSIWAAKPGGELQILGVEDWNGLTLDPNSLLEDQAVALAAGDLTFPTLRANREQFERFWPKYFEEGEEIPFHGMDTLMNWTPRA